MEYVINVYRELIRYGICVWDCSFRTCTVCICINNGFSLQLFVVFPCQLFCDGQY